VSSHGRRRQGATQGRPAPSPAQLGWALLVIAAAVIGGLAAATLVDASAAVALIVSLVVGGIGVVALFRMPGQGPDPGQFPAPRREVPTAPGARAARSASYPPDPVAPAAAPPTAAVPVRDGYGRSDPPVPDETVVQLLPLPGAQDTPWWDSAQGAPPPPSPGAKRAPAPDLSTYLAATFIAQCPRCGGFRLDIKRGRNAWDFRCESCEYTWTWQPGTSWPPVRVMPP